MNKYQALLETAESLLTINNLINSVEELKIYDYDNLMNLEDKAIKLKKQLEKINNDDPEINIKINILNGILNATGKEAFKYYVNSPIKRNKDEGTSKND